MRLPLPTHTCFAVAEKFELSNGITRAASHERVPFQLGERLKPPALFVTQLAALFSFQFEYAADCCVVCRWRSPDHIVGKPPLHPAALQFDCCRPCTQPAIRDVVPDNRMVIKPCGHDALLD